MKKRMHRAIRYMNVAGGLITVATIIGAVYIMVHKMGLVESLPFGAGSYFYADIPNFQKYVNGSHYSSPVSMGTLIILFLLWGWLMYRVWAFMEKKEDE